MAECHRCPYTSRSKRKYGSFIVIQSQFEKHKDENNELCPLVNRNTRLPGVDYGKYETEFLNVKGD